jgi:preprotein translocase subunit SecB
MAETEPSSDTNAQPAPITLTVQYLKDLSFENPNAPQSLANLNPPPSIAVDVDVEVRELGGRYFEAVVHIRATASRDEDTFFVVEVSYGGVCAIAEGVAEEHVRPLVMIEGPRLLFPFARAILADAVRDGGFPPLLINPIDFNDLYQNMQQKGTDASTSE